MTRPGRRQPGGGQQEGDVQHLPRQGLRREEALQQHRPGHPAPRSTMTENEFFKVIIDGAGRQAAAAPGSRSPPPSRTCAAPPAPRSSSSRPATRCCSSSTCSRWSPRTCSTPRRARPSPRRPTPRRSRRAAARSPASTSPRPPRRPPTQARRSSRSSRATARRAKAGRLVTFNYLGAGVRLEEAVRLLLQPRRAGAVRRRRQGPDPGLGQG